MTQFEKDLQTTQEELENWIKALPDTVISETNGYVTTLTSPKTTLDIHIVSQHDKTTQELRTIKQNAYDQGKEIYYIYPWENERLSHIFQHFTSKLGLDTRKFAAKRLAVSKVTNEIGNEFSKKYHIQKNASGAEKVSYALKIKDTGEILAVQQYCKYRWSMKTQLESPNIWEGLRLAIKPGVHIYGAASRLQKEFVKDKKPTHIISYVNYSHSLGSYKEAQGFTLLDTNKEDAYMWVLNTDSPKDVKVIDKEGKERHPDLQKVLETPYINPNRMAGSFGAGVGQTFYGGKLGSRKELKEKGNEFYHNDMILEEIGYTKVSTAGQLKWVLELPEQEPEEDFTLFSL